MSESSRYAKGQGKFFLSLHEFLIQPQNTSHTKNNDIPQDSGQDSYSLTFSLFQDLGKHQYGPLNSSQTWLSIVRLSKLQIPSKIFKTTDS